MLTWTNGPDRRTSLSGNQPISNHNKKKHFTWSPFIKMASKKTTSMISDVADFEPSLEEKKAKYREDLYNKHQQHRGGKYHPFSIEHLPNERARLMKPMTAEDRALRHQWLKDQELHPNEPIQMEELWPRNIFRRTYMAPWNFIEKLMAPHVGARWALRVRFVVPRLLMGVGAFYGFCYHMKYNSCDWERHGGWTYCVSKPRQFPDDPDFDPHKYDYDSTKFNDKNFSKRSALLDLKTSRTNYE